MDDDIWKPKRVSSFPPQNYQGREEDHFYYPDESQFDFNDDFSQYERNQDRNRRRSSQNDERN